MTEPKHGKKELSILVVDDEKTVCESVAKILRRRGHRVVEAQDAASALDVVDQSANVDMIVADLMMPRVGGMELLKILSERHTRIPVLIITGYASIGAAVEAAKLGATGFLAKPFTPEELEAAVGKAFERRERIEKDAKESSPDAPIDVDTPFDAKEAAEAMSPELGALGPAMVVMDDVVVADPPSGAKEVASVAGDAYARAPGRSDMPGASRWQKEAARPEAQPRVLVVDDEPIVANSVRRILSHKGIAVDGALTARNALTRIAAGRYDLILLDLRMPDIHGLELLPQIRRSCPDVPVVVLTGYPSYDSAVDAMLCGAVHYMTKPFTPEELYGVTGRNLAVA